MPITRLNSEEYPQTAETVRSYLHDTDSEGLSETVFIYGGAARSALIEAQLGAVRPIRDVDILAIGESNYDGKYHALKAHVNPHELKYEIPEDRQPQSISDILSLYADFTINQTIMTLDGTRAVTTDLALEACERRLIVPTAERTAATKSLQSANKAYPWKEDIKKRFKRNVSEMPARAAYHAAVLQAAGLEFKVDMGEHPVHSQPNNTFTYYLGLVVNKALAVDEIERGPGDITATQLLFGLFDTMALTRGTNPSSPEDIVAYCESLSERYSHLTFKGSQIADMVKQSNRSNQAYSL